MIEWINAEERKPAPDTLVLVWYDLDYEFAFWNNEQGWDLPGSGFAQEPIDFWAELPPSLPGDTKDE